MSTATKVLVAADAEMDEKVRDCLPGHDLTFVRTVYDAIRVLRNDAFELVVIGLNFDESRMLELLQYVRALPAYKEIPVICVYGDHLNLSDAVMKNIDVAVKALGGMAFLNLRDGALDYKKDCSFLYHVATETGAGLRPN
jgi:PleD family two-component response regulator